MNEPDPNPQAGLLPNQRLLIASSLLLIFLSLRYSQTGYDVTIAGVWDSFSDGELFFMLASTLILAPAAVFAGSWFIDTFEGRARRLYGWLSAVPMRTFLSLSVVVGVTWTLLSRLGHSRIMLDLPFTDDEKYIELGGEILASGALMHPVPADICFHPNLYLFFSDDEHAYTSFDWLGGQVAWALAHATGAGAWVFALAAGATVAALSLAVAKRMGRPLGAVCALVLMSSPMFMSLSWTVHAHLVSRLLVAVFIGLYVWSRAKPERRGTWLALGLVGACSTITRPGETIFLLGPLCLGLLHDAIRTEPELRRGVLMVALGALVPFSLFALYNDATTGHWYEPTRVHIDWLDGLPYHSMFAFLSDPAILIYRLSGNLSYNALMLVVWFAGPVGFSVAAFGAFHRDPLARRLAIGVGTMLGLALLHDDHGTHVVGPIHYSESVTALAVLFCFGVDRLRGHAIGRAYAWHRIAGTACVGVTLYGAIYMGIYSDSLQGHALPRQRYHDLVASPEYTGAVLLGPRFDYMVNQMRPEDEPYEDWMRSISYMHAPPSPFAHEDEPVVLHELCAYRSTFYLPTRAQLDTLYATYPGRPFFLWDSSLDRYTPLTPARERALLEQYSETLTHLPEDHRLMTITRDAPPSEGER